MRSNDFTEWIFTFLPTFLTLSRGCVRNLKTWVPLYVDFRNSRVPSWVPNTSFSKFVGAMAPLAPMLTHPLLSTAGYKSFSFLWITFPRKSLLLQKFLLNSPKSWQKVGTYYIFTFTNVGKDDSISVQLFIILYRPLFFKICLLANLLVDEVFSTTEPESYHLYLSDLNSALPNTITK